MEMLFLNMTVLYITIGHEGLFFYVRKDIRVFLWLREQDILMPLHFEHQIDTYAG